MNVILCILDGFGIQPFDQNNGVRYAKHWREFLDQYPWVALGASGKSVGLPEGQMGNSEVGHMTMGSGQIFYQDLPRLNKLFKNNEIWSYLPTDQHTCHIMGLLSPGGVHAHEDHFLKAVSYTAKNRPVWAHVFLDGRDSPPQSAQSSLEKLISIPHVKIATIMGRFYAMDRDQRWERTDQAVSAILQGVGPSFSDPLACLHRFYAQNITDEFIPPCVHKNYRGAHVEDSLWMMNFRADRARQILSRLQHHSWSWMLGMSQYGLDLPSVLQPYDVVDSLGERVSKAHMKQIRIAETEKYAHVTFFFNGGREEPFEGEDRIIIPSPPVRTYDEKPEMSAEEITQSVLNVIEKKTHNLVVVNYANPDMIGHTGNPDAIKKAILWVDSCIKRLEKAALAHDWFLIITSDHGNVECIVDNHNAPHTAHTCSPVPFMVISRESYDLEKENLQELKDIKNFVWKILNKKNEREISG